MRGLPSFPEIHAVRKLHGLSVPFRTHTLVRLNTRCLICVLASLETSSQPNQ